MKKISFVLLLIYVCSFLFLSIRPVSKKSDEYYSMKKSLDSLSTQLIQTQKNLEIVANQKDTDLYRLLRIEYDTLLSLPDDSLQKIQNKNLRIYSNNIKNRIDSINSLISQLESKKSKFRNKAYRAIDSLKHTPSIKPFSNADIAGITTRFGYYEDNVKHKLIYHEGIDFALTVNSPIYATADGVVELVWKDKEGYGFRISIDHGYGFRTVYAHLSRFYVREKQVVKKGQLIARSGNTGYSFGPHLHYEVHKNNIPINPLRYMVLNGFIGDRND